MANTRRRIPLSETVIRQLYVTEGLSLRAVAARLGCSADTIARRLAAWGIDRRRGKIRSSDAELQALQSCGLSQQAMAKLEGCSRSAIGARLRQMQGPAVTREEKPIPEAQLRSMCAQYREGWSAQKIANCWGLTRSVVERALRQAGVVMRRRARRTRIPEAELRYLYETQRWSVEAIAERYHVKPATASRLLRECGCTIRRHPVTFTAAQVRAQYAISGSYRETAEALGCSYATVYRYMQQAETEGTQTS